MQPAEAREAPLCDAAVPYGSQMLPMAVRQRCQHELAADPCDHWSVLDAPSASGTLRPVGDHRLAAAAR